MSLLEKALATPLRKRREPDAEKLELALAFFRGEVTFGQASAALGSKNRNVSTSLAGVLRNAVIAGTVKLERVSR